MRELPTLIDEFRSMYGAESVIIERQEMEINHSREEVKRLEGILAAQRGGPTAVVVSEARASQQGADPASTGVEQRHSGRNGIDFSSHYKSRYGDIMNIKWVISLYAPGGPINYDVETAEERGFLAKKSILEAARHIIGTQKPKLGLEMIHQYLKSALSRRNSRFSMDDGTELPPEQNLGKLVLAYKPQDGYIRVKIDVRGES